MSKLMVYIVVVTNLPGFIIDEVFSTQQAAKDFINQQKKHFRDAVEMDIYQRHVHES